MAGKVRYLLTRAGRYYARLIVPTELRSILGKRELTTALGGDRQIALRKLPRVVADMHDQIDAARGQSTNKPMQLSRHASPEQFARTFYETELRLDESERDQGLPEVREQVYATFFADQHQAALKRVASGRADDDEIEKITAWAIQSSGLLRGSSEWRRFARTVALAQLESSYRKVERDEGDFTGKPQIAFLNQTEPLANPDTTRITSDESKLALSELVGRFTSEKGMRPAAQHESRAAVRMLEEFLGGPTPIHRISKRELRQFKEALLRTPSHYVQRFPGLTLPQAITANEKRKEPLPLISTRTVQEKWLSCLRSIFRWCEQNEFLPDNPISGVQVSFRSNTGSPPRLPFDADDIKAIFAKPLFGEPEEFGELQWALLIALFTGARASEIGQLELAGIREQRGVLCFSVSGELKNAGSHRIIPVHKHLLRLGIERRVEELGCQGQTHLFPEWHADAQKSKSMAERAALEGKSQSLNQFYPRFLPRQFNVTVKKNAGITDKRKVFHGFRHTYKTALAVAGVSRAVSDMLTGHNDGSVGAIYVHGVSVQQLKEATDLVCFECFNL